ncbi:hypothetical protein FDA09_00650 [Clostridium botulinum]|nr:hypothetical protein [Clostridium botulinum]NFH81926.1 hypothetical protein [Clostridium botulinum]NFI09900.1 hypothetical protein [Clostridium botulinum]NFI14959.1 hypothetical protein [Clostridium botulinum]NFO84787.1 hypothetical protein [Clostridium botulinum]
MRATNYEDMIMKRAMDIFAEDGLKFFGIDKKVKDTGSTEIVVLDNIGNSTHIRSLSKFK